MKNIQANQFDPEMQISNPILQTHITFVPFSARRSFAVEMIDRYSYSNPLIAGVVIFILISMLIAAVALYRKVYESESCANLQPVKLLNS